MFVVQFALSMFTSFNSFQLEFFIENVSKKTGTVFDIRLIIITIITIMITIVVVIIIILINIESQNLNRKAGKGSTLEP